MIIIKISILYFIQIRHTDDFLSKGTRLVGIMRTYTEIFGFTVCNKLTYCNSFLTWSSRLTSFI